MACTPQDLLDQYGGAQFASMTEGAKQTLILCLLCRLVEQQNACCESMIEQLEQANVLLTELVNQGP